MNTTPTRGALPLTNDEAEPISEKLYTDLTAQFDRRAIGIAIGNMHSSGHGKIKAESIKIAGVLVTELAEFNREACRLIKHHLVRIDLRELKARQRVFQVERDERDNARRLAHLRPCAPLV